MVASTNAKSHAAAFRVRAWRAAGIDAGSAARMAGEHQRLVPSASAHRFQRAADVLDLDERARLMRNIATLYGRIHNAAPDHFLWAGFAAIAVNDGVRPTAERAMAIADATRLVSRFGRASAIARLAEDGIKCAFETNYSIFADIGWIHLAYLDGGMKAVHELHRAGEVSCVVREGFEDIDHGRRVGGEAGLRRIVRGNLTLFRHEQSVSVTPIFTRYRDAMSFATRIGWIVVPNRRLAARAETLGRRRQWASGESYGPFAARWRWLVRHAWEPLVALDGDRRARGCRALEAEVARAIHGRPEQGTLAERAYRSAQTALRLALTRHGGFATSVRGYRARPTRRAPTRVNSIDSE